mmetsp:Transcript_20787/g.45062  ORF Transcript_20787/g.45062 Transcript_20787/m.45062 type:complete len:321 (+) Transcript_20787:151-1113(+)|eukprot:CAMPEP_0194766898 /NCGR_PEP_ID=MMETSP0323_2-20130528/33666_1 /TAXON_ID=2866 ORGANISM="Crypthecodinium cohnii, Strain Seligo" /NCGR_SAMPLE_ID=MMETSP0323_2 /ASSEMBLY_ACC=CAM_ASM_000346 /LENGTH=320 /DNA_ID=CAMNT_0039698201 /DNA_START=47 /DNA_END=1009 /DNA_ORIENTATION=-
MADTVAARPQPLLHKLPALGRQLALWEWVPTASPKESSNKVVTILFHHATGFHGRCWDEVIRRLPHHYRCLCFDAVGHGLSDGPDEGMTWRAAAACMLEALSAAKVSRDDLDLVVGHSFGGWMATYTSACGPKPFPALLLVDPVVAPAWTYGTETSRVRQKGISAFITKRKDTFESVEEMFERFSSREPYSGWNPQVLRDYCHFGLAPAPSSAGPSLQLLCRPEIEAHWYSEASTSESNLAKEVEYLKEQRQRCIVLRAPSGSPVPFRGSPTDPELAKRLGDGAEDVLCEAMDHFIPMTHPEVVAHHILRLVDGVEASKL